MTLTELKPSPELPVDPEPDIGKKKIHSPGFTASIDYAMSGLIWAVRHERNLKIHFVAAIVVLLCSLGLELSDTRLLFVFLAVTLVIVAELFNTAVEAIMDMLTDYQHNPLARVAKDVSAAGVLIACVFSLVVAYVILVPAFSGLPIQGTTVMDRVQAHPTHAVALVISLVLVAVATGKALGEKGTFTRGGLVSGHTALAFAAATAIMLLTRDPRVSVLALLISALAAHSRVQSGIHRWSEVLTGAIAGVILSLLVFYLFQVVIP